MARDGLDTCLNERLCAVGPRFVLNLGMKKFTEKVALALVLSSCNGMVPGYLHASDIVLSSVTSNGQHRSLRHAHFKPQAGKSSETDSAPSFASGGGDVKQPLFTLDDLFGPEHLSEVAISPDGAHVAFVTVKRTPESSHGGRSSLWIIPTTGTKGPRRIADNVAGSSEMRPAWSSDSAMLAYFSNLKGQATIQLQRVDGAASTLAACKGSQSPSAFAWAPAKAQIAVMCMKKNALPRHGGGEAETEGTIVASKSSLFNGVSGSRDTRGMYTEIRVLDEHSRVHHEIAVHKTTLVADVGSIAWSRSGNDLLVTGYAYTDRNVLGRRLYHVNVYDEVVQPLPMDVRQNVFPTLSPDGEELMILSGGTKLSDGNWKRVARHSPLEFRRVNAQDGRMLSNARLPETHIPIGTAPLWTVTPDGESTIVYFVWLDRASSRIASYKPDAGTWSDITPEGANVEAFSISRDGSKMVVSQGDVNSPAEIYLYDLRHKDQATKLTALGEPTRRRYALAKVESLEWRSEDDQFDVHGWLVKPPGYVEGMRYPLIVDIHGGPQLVMNNFEEVRYAGGHQVPPELYAANGYMVLLVNYRGDVSYGSAFREAIREGWDTAVRYDILAGVDEVISRGYVDPNRLGVAGASLGGWMAAYAVSQTGRFKAASANDPVIDANIQAAVSYAGPERPSYYWSYAGYAGGLPGDRPLPTVNPQLVRTPILLRFGLLDTGSKRLGISGFFVSGLPFFSYLDTHCVPVEMVLHQYESHGISDWETKRNYIKRDLAWFNYWLNNEGEQPIEEEEGCVDASGLW